MRMPRSGVTTRLVHPSPAATVPSGRATVSSARTTVVPVGDDTTAPAVHGVDEPGGLLRDPKPLRVGALVALLGGDAGMQRDRCDEDAAGNERV